MFLVRILRGKQNKASKQGKKKFLFANNFPSVSHSVWLWGTFPHCIHLILKNTKSGWTLWASCFWTEFLFHSVLCRWLVALQEPLVLRCVNYNRAPSCCLLEETVPGAGAGTAHLVKHRPAQKWEGVGNGGVVAAGLSGQIRSPGSGESSGAAKEHTPEPLMLLPRSFQPQQTKQLLPLHFCAWTDVLLQWKCGNEAWGTYIFSESVFRELLEFLEHTPLGFLQRKPAEILFTT